MKYFKLMQGNTFVGAISSNNFITYQTVIKCFVRTNEIVGEYVDYNGELYRDSWMCPIVKELPYSSVIITEISEEEFNIYIQALVNNEEILISTPTEATPEEVIDTTDIDAIVSLEFVRKAKLNEMSKACKETIESGFDLELRNEVHHFSLDTQDQLNLMSLSILAQTQSSIPYHADNEECIFYTAEEINEIVSAANTFKIYHTTYYNALKKYINTLETMEEIGAITYGIEIPEKYQTDVLKTLE